MYPTRYRIDSFRMRLIISRVNLALLNGICGHIVKHYTFLFDFSTGRPEMSAGRCRLHSVWSNPFHLGAFAYFLGCVFLPCPKPYKRPSKWN